MVNVLASVAFIQKIIFEYEHYTVSDFNKSKDIDMESFIFFKKIITDNKAHLYLNICDDKIEQYKSDPKNVEEHEKDIAYFISTFRNAKIWSNVELYNNLMHCNEINMPLSELPCFLLLDNVGEDICKKIESNYGINCFSLKRLKVDEIYRVPKPFSIKNTKEGLFEKLNMFNYHTLELYDPYFLTNSSVTEDAGLNFDFLKRIKLNGIKKINVTIHSDLIQGRFQLGEFEKRKAIFENDIKKLSTEQKCEINLEITKKAKHDRFIFTNTTINMVGNSFNTNAGTYINSFPKIIYSDFYS